jgi:hypothetical protein
MRTRTILKVCVLVLIVGLFILSKPISLDSYPPALLPPGGGVSTGLAQGGEEETVVFSGEALDEPSGPIEGTEVLEKRTLTSKTYQLGSNQYRALISTLPMHYTDEEGNWQDISTAIQRQDDGSYYSDANLVKARFPGQLSAEQGIDIEIPLSHPGGPSSARIEPLPAVGSSAATNFEEVSVTWRPIKLMYRSGGDLAAQEISSARVSEAPAAVSDNVIVYGNAFPDVAEEFTVVPGGVKHSLVLSNLPGFVPDNPPLDSFLDYQVEMTLLPGINLYVDGVEQKDDFSTSSTIELRRGEKEIVGYLLAPYAYEKDDPRQQTACTHAVHYEQDRIIITVRTSLSWLAAPDRAYPVVIDPTTNAYLWQDTFMSDMRPTTVFGAWPSMYAGYDPSYGFGRERALMHWSVDPIPASSNITSASIWLYQTWSAGNASCTLAFFRMVNYWSSAYATWYNRAYGTAWNSPGAGTDYYTGGYGFSFNNVDDTWKVLSAAGIGSDWVRGWIDGTYTNNGIMLKPWSWDSYVECERGFLTMNDSEWWNAAYLTVDYTFTGGTPTTLYHNSPQTHTYPNPEHYYVEDSASHTAYWRGTALRPLGQSDYDLWLHTSSDFSAWQVGSSYGVGRVDYTLTKEYVTTTGYPRVVRYQGADNYNITYMRRFTQLDPPYSGGWQLSANAFWGVFELHLSSPGSWQVVVTPLSGNPDLGVAIHDPTAGNYQTRGGALALSDQSGQNLTERFEFTAPSAGYYGLVVWSNVHTGVIQQFRLEVKPPPSKSYLPVIMKNYVPPQGPFSNGGFENNSRWILSGELKHKRTTVKHRSGSYSVQLGLDGSSPCLGKVPCSPAGSENCESFAMATQGFDVPNSGSPSLSFYYQIYTYDHKPSERPAADYFAAYIRDLSTSTETLVYLDDLSWVSTFDCDHSVNAKSSWQPVSSINLSPYKGKTVELIFKVTNGGHNFWNTWVYIDDVTCSGC